MSNSPLGRSQAWRPQHENCVPGVDAVNDRCLLQDCDSASGIKYAHLVPRALAQDDTLMTNLEWYWGMTRRTLILDTYYNVFPCGIQLHMSYDALRWGLLPSEDIVMQYHDSLTKVHFQFYAERHNFPNIPDGQFFYRFLPLHGMRTVTITRHMRVPTAENPLNPADTVVHCFPFDTMPLLRSHVHPKFAIFDLGRRISTLPVDVKITLITANPILSFIIVIHRAGSENRLAEILVDPVFNPPSSGSDDGDDPKDEDWSEASAIPRRDCKRKTAKSPPPSTHSERSRPSGKTMRSNHRAIHRCVPPSDPHPRVKEWVYGAQLALEAARFENGCAAFIDSNVQVDTPDAEALLKFGSRSYERHLDDAEKPTPKKRKISLVDCGREEPRFIDS